MYEYRPSDTSSASRTTSISRVNQTCEGPKRHKEGWTAWHERILLMWNPASFHFLSCGSAPNDLKEKLATQYNVWASILWWLPSRQKTWKLKLRCHSEEKTNETGWWFQIVFLMFTPILGEMDPIWPIFSFGLKPPTRKWLSKEKLQNSRQLRQVTSACLGQCFLSSTSMEGFWQWELEGV